MKSYFRVGLIVALVLSLPLIYFGVKRTKTQIELSQITKSEGMFEVHHWISPEGTKVAFSPLHQLPILDIHVVFAAGSAQDGSKFGNAQLVQQLIGEDTINLTGDAIHDAFESVGAQFSSSVNQDLLDLSLRTMTQDEFLKTSLATFQTILSKTSFTQPSFDREKQRLLTIIMSNKQDPRTTIGNAFYEKMYGSHPYGHPVTGTAETVSALTLDDIQQFHANYLVKENAVIAIAGDLSLEQAKDIADQLIAAMPSGKAAPAIPPVQQPQAHTEQLSFPSSQTHIIMGLPTIAKGNPDFYALSVGNQILGVTPLVNRLFNEVREKEGLAYNVGSAITTLKEPGPFRIYLQSRNGEANKAATLVHETLVQYLQQGPTEKELQSAKENIYGQFILGLSNNAAIAAHLATLAFYDLPWDYQDHFHENINKVSIEDIKSVFGQYIKPDEFTSIRLGESS